MEVIVEVTQEDIDAGIAGKCFTCPIALALRRVFGRRISVAGYYFNFGNEHYVSVAESAKDFIR